MPVVILSLIVAVLALAALVTLYALLLQRSHIISVGHLVSNLAQGQYARRTDPAAKGAAGDLAKAANALADDLEIRHDQAQQDKDHLLSLLAVIFSKLDTLERYPFFLKLLVFTIPLPYLANQFGWILTEMGRQPWIVYGIMKTSDGVSKSITSGNESDIAYGIKQSRMTTSNSGR